MFVLHVKIRMKTGAEKLVERFFLDTFNGAITKQPGFCDVKLLRPDDGNEYVLSIAFENKVLQQQWVATPLHQQVWSQMEAHFESYALDNFTAV